MIRMFPGEYDQLSDLSYTCLSNCDPAAELSGTDDMILIDGLLATGITEPTLIEFTLSGFTIPNTNSRLVYYY